MGDNYLYRALRKEEIEAGNLLIPKGQGPFAANPRWGIDTRFPFIIGIVSSGISNQPVITGRRCVITGLKLVVKRGEVLH